MAKYNSYQIRFNGLREFLEINIQKGKIEMKLKHICLLTENVRKLYLFYKEVTQLDAKFSGIDYVEFDLGGTKLSIYNIKAHNTMVDDLVTQIQNTSSMIEIEVDDVDMEYERLCQMNIKCAKLPTTQPWGTRSVYFYDPDENLINFFSRVNFK